MPIILQSALVSNILFISQLLFRNFEAFSPVGLFGSWLDTGELVYQSSPPFPFENDWISSFLGRGHMIPVGGLAYYMSPPMNFAEVAEDPIHAILYGLRDGMTSIYLSFLVPFSPLSYLHACFLRSLLTSLDQPLWFFSPWCCPSAPWPTGLQHPLFFFFFEQNIQLFL